MRTKSVLSMFVLIAAALTFGLYEANAGFPAPPGVLIPPGLPGSNVNVHVDGYIPAPPGVHIMYEADRPYYIERDRRVYMERDNRGKKYKKEKRHKENRGNKYGHYKHEDDRHGGHGH